MSNPLAQLPTRAARWSATHPWRAIGAGPPGRRRRGPRHRRSTKETTDADYRIGESGRAER